MSFSVYFNISSKITVSILFHLLILQYIIFLYLLLFLFLYFLFFFFFTFSLSSFVFLPIFFLQEPSKYLLPTFSECNLRLSYFFHFFILISYFFLLVFFFYFCPIFATRAVKVLFRLLLLLLQ